VLHRDCGAAAQCPISYGATDDAKPNKLYLQYSAVADASFSEYGGPGYETSPLDPFDVSLLTSFSGSAAGLQAATTDVVVDDYCEFNVQVRTTTSTPPATFARREIVGIGTDNSDTGRWGRADLTDVGDPTPVGYGRVWVGEYQDSAGFPGGALNGVNSTTQRWANAIGGTAAHEAGHGYGLIHNTTLAPGEDAFGRHLMPAGSDVSQEERAGYRRHFSDNDFSILASNVGLSVQTMHNWDLVNPNSSPGHRFRLTFLSTQPSMLMTWAYEDSLSPWINPTVSSFGTQAFKGTTYNRYRMTWSTGQGWSGGPSGQVPAGGDFHVGATFSGVNFNQPDPIIITNSKLLDADGDPLPLKPRLPGYDSGTISLDAGIFEVAFTNFFVNPGDPPMRLRNVVIRQLPRVMSINSMLPRARIRDPFGEQFSAWPGGTKRMLTKGRRLPGKRRSLEVEVARLRERRHILAPVDQGCGQSDAPNGLSDSAACKAGFNASLFPATTMLLTADAVTPRAKVWDRGRKRFVRRSLTSRIYYQFGGRRIDLNKNGVDDAIEIAFLQGRDSDGDGVLDEAER